MIGTVFKIALLRLWNNKQELLACADRADPVLQHFRVDLRSRYRQRHGGDQGGHCRRRWSSADAERLHASCTNSRPSKSISACFTPTSSGRWIN